MPKHDPTRVPASYPVSFNEALRLIIGGKYKKRRLEIYRAMVRSLVVYEQQAHNPPHQPVAEAVNHWVSQGKLRLFYEAEFLLLRRDLMQTMAVNRENQARNAAKTRWSKKKRKKVKKRLDRLSGSNKKPTAG